MSPRPGRSRMDSWGILRTTSRAEVGEKSKRCYQKPNAINYLEKTLYRVRIPASPPLPRARSVLTARQGFRHRTARTARRDSARNPRSFPISRVRSVLTARQGFRHRTARTARRDSARNPRSFPISRVRSVLTARQGFRHRAARTARRDSARIRRSFSYLSRSLGLGASARLQASRGSRCLPRLGTNPCRQSPASRTSASTGAPRQPSSRGPTRAAC